jgi:triose/dihydroxyacetone kinase / FAD-AMP lyase (cyclizing)
MIWDNPAATLAALSQTLREALGGSSGPLYAVFFLRAAREPGTSKPEAQWARAFLAGCQGMSDLGGRETRSDDAGCFVVCR